MEEWTILFVDDEPMILSSVRRLFRRSRYRVLVAESGFEAQEILAREPVQVLVTDQRMPGMTGVELCQWVAKEHPAVIRFILSGYADVEEMMAAIEQGEVHRFLTKPVDMYRLVEIVERAVEQSETVQDFQRLLQELNQKGARYRWDIDSRNGIIRVSVEADKNHLRRELAADLLRCLFDDQNVASRLHVIGSVIERHNGMLTIHAEFGVGLRAAIELPLEERAAVHEEQR